MTAFLKCHLPIVAAVVVLILGGAVAAMAAASTSSSGAHHHGLHSGRTRKLLDSAAAYIGIPDQTLTAELRSGKSLGQIALAAGKTEAGLVKALTATASAGAEERFSELVKRPGGLHGRHGQARALRLAASKYLGVTPEALRTDLRGGKSLAEIADSTPGHSSAALISALLSAREAELSSKAAGAKSGSENGAARSARLRARITAYVDRSHLKAAGHKPGG